MQPFKNILLIDDDDDDQEIFLTALSRVSSSVAFYGENNAAEALEKLMAGQLLPDVIFLDLNMPIMTGDKFLAEIKQSDLLKNIPVIVYSTSAQPGTIRMARELGATGFVTKPDTLDALVNILSSYF